MSTEELNELNDISIREAIDRISCDPRVALLEHQDHCTECNENHSCDEAVRLFNLICDRED